MTKEELLKELHKLYNDINVLHHDIYNCISITDEQSSDLIDCNSEIIDTIRYMICTIE